MRMKMRENSTVMRNQKRSGGACMTIAQIDLNLNQVEFFSIGDTLGFVETYWSEKVFETKSDKKSNKSNGVTRAITSQLPGLEFNRSGVYQLSPGDRIHCMSDDVDKVINYSDVESSKKISHYFEVIDNAKNLGISNQDNISIVSFELNR